MNGRRMIIRIWEEKQIEKAAGFWISPRVIEHCANQTPFNVTKQGNYG